MPRRLITQQSIGVQHSNFLLDFILMVLCDTGKVKRDFIYLFIFVKFSTNSRFDQLFFYRSRHADALIFHNAL